MSGDVGDVGGEGAMGGLRLGARFAASDSVVCLMGIEEGAFLDINPAFTRILGYMPEEVLGKVPTEIGLWPDMATRSSIWAGIRADKRVCRLRIRVRCADQRILVGFLSCEIVTHGPGLAVFCLVQELQEEDEASRPTERQDSYHSLYLAAAEGIYRSLPGSGFIDVNPAMAKIFGYDSPGQMLLELCRDAARLYADPVQGASLHRELIEKGRIEEYVCRARRRDGSAIWISENARAVTDEQGNTLFLEGTIVDITARVEAEEALRQSEALYKVLVENSREGVFLIQRGRVVFANPALAALLGREPGELAGVPYMDLVVPEDRPAQLARRQAREDGSWEAQRYEITLMRRDGGRVLCEVHADAVEYNGDIASTGVIRDVTLERTRQRELAVAEQRYRELFESSPIGLFRTRRDGSIAEVNPALAQVLGYASPAALKEEVGGMEQLYFDAADRARLLDELRAAGGVADRVTRMRRRDGSEVWLSANIRMIEGDDGQPHFAGSVQDITQRRATEEALRRSQKHYQTLVEHSQSGVFMSAGGRYVYVNRTYAAMLGYDEQTLCDTPFEKIVAPEYWGQVRERVERQMRGEVVPREYETCLLHRNGSRVYVSVSIGPVEVEGEHLFIGTVRDISNQRLAEQRLRFNASHDPLTGLPNRTHFQERLQVLMQASALRLRHDYAVLFLDLDGFKWVNDSLGHDTGDRLLVAIARMLSKELGEEALLARYGGDEFTLLPNGSCNLARAEGIANRVLDLFEKPVDIGGHKVYTGTSIGIVLGRSDYEGPDQVLRDADTAMYRAKARGRSGYAVFDEAMHAEVRRRFELETDIRKAFEASEFRVHFQPIVHLADRRVIGCEALVRWQHPVRGLLLPDEFLPVAEETGLIADLDDWVMGQALAKLARWRSLPECGSLTLSVNMDEQQLSDPDVLRDITLALGAASLPPEAIRLEVTERVFRAGAGLAQERLKQLKALGLGLVVDDFGTGYSSLDSFVESPFDALKIDRSFLRDVESNARHRAIVRTITRFADDLGLGLVAEGIETEGQRDMLLAIGCVYGQGFLFSRAVPAEEFEAMLRRGLPAHLARA